LTTFIDHRRVPRTSLTGTSEPAGRAVTVAALCWTSHRTDAIANGSDRQKGARRLPTRQKDQMGGSRGVHCYPCFQWRKSRGQ